MHEFDSPALQPYDFPLKIQRLWPRNRNGISTGFRVWTRFAAATAAGTAACWLKAASHLQLFWQQYLLLFGKHRLLISPRLELKRAHAHGPPCERGAYHALQLRFFYSLRSQPCTLPKHADSPAFMFASSPAAFPSALTRTIPESAGRWT